MSIGIVKDVWAKEKSFKVLRVRETGRILIAVDRFDGVRRVKGPVLSEDDLMRLMDLMSECGGTMVHGGLSRQEECGLDVASEKQASYIPAGISVLDEIALAIEKASEAPRKKAPVITVLPALPEFRYVHTCPQCDSHVSRPLGLTDDSALLICPVCNHIYKKSE